MVSLGWMDMGSAIGHGTLHLPSLRRRLMRRLFGVIARLLP
jgi:hypothetical protein